MNFNSSLVMGPPVFKCSSDKGSYVRMETKKPMIESNTMNCVVAAYDTFETELP